MVGIADLDLDVLPPAIEIFRRHLCYFHRTHAVGVLEDAGDIVEHADPYDIAGNFGMPRSSCGAGQCQRQIKHETDVGPRKWSTMHRCRRDEEGDSARAAPFV